MMTAHNRKMNNGFAALALLLAVILQPLILAAEHFTLDTVRAQVRQDFKGVPHLSTGELARAMAAKDNLLVLDVRERNEFAVSRIKGAHRVDPGIWRWTFMNRFGDRVRGKTVVFYCSVGVRSSKLAAYVQAALKEQGAKGVYNLDGGVFAWH
ncbi:MAG: rhodanese-like domain-containing protein, partial [Alphaproteobacteria bacterium]